MYWQALRDEVAAEAAPDGVDGPVKWATRGAAVESYQSWVSQTANANEADFKAAIGIVCDQFLKKAKRGEQWTNLPQDAHRGPVRVMHPTIPHIMAMTLWKDLNTARKGGWSRAGSLFDNDAFKAAKEILGAKGTAARKAKGTEARQRSDNELFVHEQLDLIASILGGKVAAAQRAKSKRDDAPRKVIDTLSLGVVNQLHFALGQRGVNVRPALPLDYCSRV